LAGKKLPVTQYIGVYIALFRCTPASGMMIYRRYMPVTGSPVTSSDDFAGQYII